LAEPCGAAKQTSSAWSSIELPPEVRALIPDYLKGRTQDIQQLAEALENSDFERIRVIGHNLKGSGSSYGFRKSPRSDCGCKRPVRSGMVPGPELLPADLRVEMASISVRDGAYSH
jgi:hypothetical protein